MSQFAFLFEVQPQQQHQQQKGNNMDVGMDGKSQDVTVKHEPIEPPQTLPNSIHLNILPFSQLKHEISDLLLEGSTMEPPPTTATTTGTKIDLMTLEGGEKKNKTNKGIKRKRESSLVADEQDQEQAEADEDLEGLDEGTQELLEGLFSDGGDSKDPDEKAPSLSNAQEYYAGTETPTAIPPCHAQHEAIFMPRFYVQRAELGTGALHSQTPQEHKQRMLTTLFDKPVHSNAIHESELLYQCGPAKFGTVIRNVPGCCLGDKCEGLSGEINIVRPLFAAVPHTDTVGCQLRAYFTPKEWQEFKTHGTIPFTITSRPCVLDLRIDFQKKQILLNQQTARYRIDLEKHGILASLANPIQGVGAYRPEATFQPPAVPVNDTATATSGSGGGGDRDWKGYIDPHVNHCREALTIEFDVQQGLWYVNQSAIVQPQPAETQQQDF